jgi:hypothetical protein
MPVKLASDRGETRWLRGKHWTGGRRAPVEEELRRHAFAAAGAQGPGTRTGRDAIRFAARAGSRSAFLRTRRGDAVNPARPPGGSTANRWVLHACTQVVALVRGAPPDPVSQTEASGGHHSRSDEPLAARAQPADRRAADRAAIRSGCMEQEGAGRVVDLHHPALNHVHPQDAVDAASGLGGERVHRKGCEIKPQGRRPGQDKTNALGTPSLPERRPHSR